MATLYTPMQALGLKVAIPFAVALFVGFWAHRKKSLTLPGAIAAVCVGTAHFSAGLTPGVLLLAFFFSSNKLTKLGVVRKAALADEGGQLHGPKTARTAVQVLCNSLLPTFACLALLRCSGAPCGIRTHTILQLSVLAHYACCCADTWASEVGMLARHAPVLITTLRPVPTGTNGGVSGLGTAMAVLGGAFMGLSMACTMPFLNDSRLNQGVELLQSHILPDSAAWGVPSPGVLPQWLRPICSGVSLVAFGAVFGLWGCCVDSILGASLQYSGFDEVNKVVVHSPAQGIKHVSGVAILSNSAVNALSSLITVAAAVAFLHSIMSDAIAQ